MKKSIIYPLLLAVSTMFFVGCEKNDGPIDKSIAIEDVPQIAIVKNGGSQSIDLTNLASFSGTYQVKLLYPSDIQPAKLDVVIRKNSNNANVKLVQAGITTYPANFTITAAQLSALFGNVAIALGDNYELGVDIYTTSGKKYEAFPTVGAAYGSTGVANQPGFSATIIYSAICAYNPDLYQGNFVVVTDAWADFVPGDIVPLTKISATQFSWIDPFAVNPKPVVVTVNPADNTLTIPTQTIGTSWSYSANPATYPNASVSASGANNFVSPCAQTVTMNIQYGINGGSAIFGGGPYLLVFRKQ